MADLSNLPIVKADPNILPNKKVPKLMMTSMMFGASMSSAGLGAGSNNNVSDQSTVEVPVITEPVQYWG